MVIKRLWKTIQEPPLPPPPCLNWDGSERRRRVGSKADRKMPDPNALYFRIYDYEELRKRILKGKEISSMSGDKQNY
jgi:hypothetical protein